LKEFDSVFSNESFDTLPESKKWDHAVKLIPGEKASNCKVYPLALTEQKELDLISKLINKLRGAKYFTKLDVQWGFNNVWMKEGDEWKAVFRTN